MKFVQDPIGTLEKLGGVLMQQREIRLLYRIRDRFDFEESEPGNSRSVRLIESDRRPPYILAYPIVITEATDSALSLNA
jgi:hypothetical protein